MVPSPLSVSVRPAGSVPSTKKVAAGRPEAFTVSVPARPSENTGEPVSVSGAAGRSTVVLALAGSQAERSPAYASRVVPVTVEPSGTVTGTRLVPLLATVTFPFWTYAATGGVARRPLVAQAAWRWRTVAACVSVRFTRGVFGLKAAR